MPPICKALICHIIVVAFVTSCSPDILEVNSKLVRTFSGRVVQTRSAGIPVGNALVECMGRVAVTDTAGAFSFPDLEMDKERTIVRVYASHRLPATHAFVPTDSSVTSYTIVLPGMSTVRSSSVKDAYVFSRGSQTISLPLDAFVTRLGAPYTGAVTAIVASYDMGQVTAPLRLGDNGAVFADGTKGVLEQTTVTQYAFLGADNDTVFVRPNTICAITQGVSVAPEFEKTMAIFTFDHSSAFWKVAGQATLTSKEYKGTFVWGNDVTMNFLKATRRHASIRVLGPDGQPIRRCAVSLSGRTSYTDSLGYCGMQLVAERGTTVDIRDVTNTEIFATYSMDGVSEADPGQHTIVLQEMPVMLTGTINFCAGTSVTAGYVVLYQGNREHYFVSRASSFSAPIPRNPQFDVFAHNGTDLKSGIVRITPTSVMEGVVNVGNLSICASNVEDQSLLPLPEGSIVVSAATRRSTGGVFVVTANRLLTYNSNRELIASVPLSSTIGVQDTAFWTSYVSNNDQYIYLTNSRRIVDAIETATGRVVFHHEFSKPEKGWPVIGVDVESAQVVYVYIRAPNLYYSTYSSLSGQQLMQDSIPLSDIGRPAGLEGTALFRGQTLLIRFYHLEYGSAACIKLDPKREIRLWEQDKLYFGLSKGGSLMAVGLDGNGMLYNASTDRYVPFPTGSGSSSFFTSSNDKYLATMQSGRIAIFDAATGKQTVSKQALPPQMRVPYVDLSDSGTQLCVISGSRSSAKVLIFTIQ